MTKRRGRPFISVCYITKNEERFLAQSLESLGRLPDEVLVGDTGSTDRTVAIAREHGAKVFAIPWEDDFAKARNAVLSRAQGEWAVFVDGDEWFGPGEALRLRRIIADVSRNFASVGISIYQTNLSSLTSTVILDRTRTVRVFRNRPTHRYQFAIHEQILPALHGQVVVTDVELMHAGFTAEIAAGKKKGDRNLRLLQKMIDDMPSDNPHMRYLLMQRGREYHRASRLDEALASYEEAAGALLADEGQRPSAFASVLFAYICEVLSQKEDWAPIGKWADKFERLVPLPQADVPFFRGFALLHLGDGAKGGAELVKAVACFEGAPAGQELLSQDRQVLSYAALADAATSLMGAFEWAVRGLARYPDRDVLTARAAKLLQVLGQKAVARLPDDSLPPVAQAALHEKLYGVCLLVAQQGLAVGQRAVLPWAAVAALRLGDPARALKILDGVKLGDADAEQVAELQAMASWGLQNTVEFERAVDRTTAPMQAALRLWAGLQVDPETLETGKRALQMLDHLYGVPSPIEMKALA